MRVWVREARERLEKSKTPRHLRLVRPPRSRKTGELLIRGSVSRRLRVLLLVLGGGRCVCCGEGQREFLNLDHIDRDGAAHRKRHRNWNRNPEYFYEFLRGSIRWQILCFNCNYARERCGGVCPCSR